MQAIAYFVVSQDDELHGSARYDLEPILGLPQSIHTEEYHQWIEKIITFIHGKMFEQDWCPQTPHAIYLNRGKGNTCIYDEGGVEDLVYQDLMES